LGFEDEMVIAEKMDSSHPWSSLPIQVPDKTRAFFVIAMQTEIGDRPSHFFGVIDGSMVIEWQI
jgi:hypothetical protein